MKETDTMQSYKYLQAIFGDKWVDWGVSVGFLLLIASWFVPRNTVDFLVDFIVTGLMLVVAIRIGCVIVRVRRGDELSRESARSVRFREVMGNVVFLSFFSGGICGLIPEYAQRRAVGLLPGEQVAPSVSPPSQRGI